MPSAYYLSTGQRGADQKRMHQSIPPNQPPRIAPLCPPMYSPKLMKLPTKTPRRINPRPIMNFMYFIEFTPYFYVPFIVSSIYRRSRAVNLELGNALFVANFTLKS